MVLPQLLVSARQVPAVLRRNFGICVPAAQKASDPIQQLFVDKIREYKQKSRHVYNIYQVLSANFI